MITTLTIVGLMLAFNALVIVEVTRRQNTRKQLAKIRDLRRATRRELKRIERWQTALIYRDGN